MTNREEIKSIIVKSLESAENYEIADCYNHMVICGDCPYWHDCRNEHDCGEYILDKLEADDKERINPYEKCKTCVQDRASCCGCPEVLELERKKRTRG